MKINIFHIPDKRIRIITYLVVIRTVGCSEIRLWRTIHLIHNIQAAHGWEQQSLKDRYSVAWGDASLEFADKRFLKHRGNTYFQSEKCMSLCQARNVSSSLYCQWKSRRVTDWSEDARLLRSLTFQCTGFKSTNLNSERSHCAVERERFKKRHNFKKGRKT